MAILIALGQSLQFHHLQMPVHGFLYEQATECILYLPATMALKLHKTCIFLLFQVSALLGRIPSAVGYQPTLATDMGTMQERITTTRKGSITSVQVTTV